MIQINGPGWQLADLGLENYRIHSNGPAIPGSLTVKANLAYAGRPHESDTSD